MFWVTLTIKGVVVTMGPFPTLHGAEAFGARRVARGEASSFEVTTERT